MAPWTIETEPGSSDVSLWSTATEPNFYWNSIVSDPIESERFYWAKAVEPVDGDPGVTGFYARWCSWINPNTASNRKASFLGVTEDPFDLHVTPEDMDITPEEMQADEDLWTIEDEPD